MINNTKLNKNKKLIKDLKLNLMDNNDDYINHFFFEHNNYYTCLTCI